MTATTTKSGRADRRKYLATYTAAAESESNRKAVAIVAAARQLAAMLDEYAATGTDAAEFDLTAAGLLDPRGLACRPLASLARLRTRAAAFRVPLGQFLFSAECAVLVTRDEARAARRPR